MTPARPEFDGTWVLLPELSFYDTGTPPRAGTYTVTHDGDKVGFSVSWENDDGQAMAVKFGGPLGPKVVVDDTPGVTHARFDMAPDGALVSEAFNGQDRVAYAMRRVSADGRLLSILQRITGPDGREMRIYQLYRRAGAARPH